MGSRDHKPYGACHSRIILDQAHYFKSTRTQIKSFIRNLNGKFVDLGERDYGERLGSRGFSPTTQKVRTLNVYLLSSKSSRSWQSCVLNSVQIDRFPHTYHIMSEAKMFPSMCRSPITLGNCTKTITKWVSMVQTYGIALGLTSLIVPVYYHSVAVQLCM